MSKLNFWKKTTPAVLSAAVALTSMPVAAFAAVEDVMIEEAAVVVEDAVSENISAEEQVSAGGFVYGTANIPYADFFYGELNSVTANAQMQLDKADPVTASGYRATGMYDAVTSATNNKCKRYTTSYYDDLENGGVSLNGIKDVNIAVPTSLYEAAKKAIAENKSCANQLLVIVGSLQNVTETAPAEYKILNGDGTLGAMVTETKKLNLETSITTGTAWGNYQVSVEFGDGNVDQPTTENMMGVIFETSDGKKYGMEHSENLWLQTGEIAFAVKDGFVEPHGNTVEYQRHADLQGKTIKKITYLVKDGADIVIDNTNLLCKYLLAGDQTILATEETVVYTDDAKVQMTRNVPAGSNYALASVTYGGQILTEGTDYTYENDVLTIKKTENTAVGAYTLVYTDASYEDISTQVIFSAGLKSGDVKLEGNKLTVNSEKYTAADYLAAVTSVKVDGAALGGRKTSMSTVTSAIFKEDASVNFDAKINDQAVFTKGAADSYELSISAAGFPDVTGTVCKTPVVENKGITAKAQKSTIYTKGQTTTTIKVTKTGVTGTAKFKSSNTKIATVNSKGVVTAKKAGTVKITVQVGSYKKVVTIQVKNPTLKLAKTSAVIKKGAKTTIKATATPSGKITYKSSNKKVATVTTKGVVKGIAKGTAKITVTCNGVKKTFTVKVK